MKDFAKSIVCNTKAGNSMVGNARISIVKVDDDSDDFGSSKRKGMYKVIDERGSSLGWFKTMEEAKKEKEFWEKQKTDKSKVGNFTIGEGVKGKEELNTKYKDNLRVAKEALSRVSRKISGYENASNIHWGHLGDIAHIAEQLKEIA